MKNKCIFYYDDYLYAIYRYDQLYIHIYFFLRFN